MQNFLAYILLDLENDDEISNDDLCKERNLHATDLHNYCYVLSYYMLLHR